MDVNENACGLNERVVWTFFREQARSYKSCVVIDEISFLPGSSCAIATVPKAGWQS